MRKKKMNKFKLLLQSIAIVGLLFVAFSVSEAAKVKYKEVEVKNGSTIKGKVTWMGTIPKLPPITVFKHMDKCGQEAINPALIINPSNRGVKFTAVYLEKIKEGKSINQNKLKVGSNAVLHVGQDIKQQADSQLCNFQEHVFAFVRTKKVGMYNMENLLHNPHAFGKNGATIFNIPLPDRNRMSKKKVKRVKGINRYQCDTHVHMNGYMLGLPHPYFSVTDKNGNYEIANVPNGKYNLITWHEGYNITEFASDKRPVYDAPHIIKTAIEVKDGQVLDLNFQMPVRDVKVNQKKMSRQVSGH